MGAIHPRAIREFRTKPRDNHSWMKQLSDKELNQALWRIGFRPARENPPLDKHQKVCILLCLAYKVFALWLDMGTGKSRVALEALYYLIKCKELKSAFILAPSESVLISWENQIRLWRIKLPYVVLGNSSSEDKWDALAEVKNGFVLATYAGLTRMLSNLEIVRRKGKPEKRRLNWDQKKIKRLLTVLGKTGVVWDESTKIAKKGSLAWRISNQLSKKAPVRLELAGRPLGRDPHDLWAQLFLVDRGETLGDTLGIFRAAFFHESPNFWGGMEYKLNKKHKDRLNQVIRHRSIQYSEEETGAHHKIVPKLEEVRLPDEAEAYYQQFAKQIVKEQLGLRERENAFLRMRQVSSGFVGFTNDDTGKRAEIAFKVNPKLDRLLELIEEMPIDRKFVIFHEFTYSGASICKALAKLKIRHVRGWSGTASAREFQDEFDNNPKVRGAVINHRWGAYGLNLQAANYQFVYESPVSVIDRVQMDKRLPRKGQPRTVFRYDLVCRGTVDHRILLFHRQGGDLWDALRQDPRRALGL